MTRSTSARSLLLHIGCGMRSDDARIPHPRQLAAATARSGSQALALSVVVSNAISNCQHHAADTGPLSPEVYGITGMILAVFFVINMLSDVGFQAYIVRHERSDEPNFLNAVWISTPPAV